MRGIGYLLKIAKISSRKTQKSPIRKNKIPQKFLAARYLLLALNLSFAR